MPIHEYKCNTCGNKFEKLVLPTRDETIVCDACGCSDVQKLFSAFGFSSSGKSSAGSGCTSCSSSNCSSCGK